MTLARMLAASLSCLACGVAAVAVAEPLSIGDTFVLHSQALGEDRRINVYWAPGFAPAAGKPLPVLYMPDGGIAEDFLHVAGLLEVGVGNNTMRPMLLVGVENTERRRDMTGPTQNPEDRKIAPHVGGSQSFREFFRTELMPEIRRRYPVTAASAIVGESLAGLFVTETFLREPDLFDTYIAFDPSLWWNRDELIVHADSLLRAHDRTGKVFFMASSGYPDLAKGCARFEQALKRANGGGARHEYRPMPAETHATIYHPAALVAFRRVLAPPAEEPAK